MHYSICDLGTEFFPDGLNSAGLVVGSRHRHEGDLARACLYDAGVLHDLGVGAGVSSLARAINDHGQITSDLRLDFWNWHAYRYADGMATDLGTLYGYRAVAFDSNDHGHVVGCSTAPVGPEDVRWEQRRHERAFLHDGEAMRDLGTLGGRFAWAKAINDQGQIVGWAETADGSDHAFLYDATGMKNLCASLAARYSRAEDSNSAGQIVGYAANHGGFLYCDGELIFLGRVAEGMGAPLAINDVAQIVGSAAVPRERRHGRWARGRRAFLGERGEIFDLLDLIDTPAGSELVMARDINNTGQIVGPGYYLGEGHAFLLTPMSGN
jgi:probable HAF family extracellular repeat protein